MALDPLLLHNLFSTTAAVLGSYPNARRYTISPSVRSAARLGIVLVKDAARERMAAAEAPLG
jgi:hypothetical protein